MSKIIESIVTQHAEEAAFLWLLREGTITAPHYNLKDLTDHDDRIDAHVDGLRIAGERGWEICKIALGQEEAGEMFAASVLAFERAGESRIEAVLEVGAKSYGLSRGLVSALGWILYASMTNSLTRLLNADSPFLRRIGLAGMAVHRQDPGPVLGEFLNSDDTLLRSRALKAAGELGRRDLMEHIKASYTSEDFTRRFWAAWAGALLGERASLPVLQEMALAPSPFQERASALALRALGLDRALEWHKELVAKPDLLRLAAQGVGVIGDRVLIPWLLEQMTRAEIARVAGESFSMITGLDLEYENFEAEWPEGFEAGPTENPEDEDVTMDGDEDLPWPHVERIQKWWSQNKGRFTDGTRYLCGQPMTIESLNQVLRTGRQRQRIAAAIELAMRQPGTPLFNTSAPGFRQQALLK
jgi:uncharacterized protein (TIGR02270 family)